MCEAKGGREGGRGQGGKPQADGPAQRWQEWYLLQAARPRAYARARALAPGAARTSLAEQSFWKATSGGDTTCGDR